MKLLKSSFLILLSIVIFSCYFANKPKITIVNEVHKTILYNYIDPIAEKYNLPKLRNYSLYGNDAEVRIWVSEFESDGFILRRYNNEWSAISIKEIDCGKVSYYGKNKIYESGKTNLSAPKSGWENSWQKLVNVGILDLPDSSELPEYENKFIDGIGYFVEVNINGKYRTYSYSNPQAQKLKEAEKIIKIGKIISDEFSLSNFEIGSLCVEK